MKKAFLLLAFSLITYSSFSQDPQLIDNNWYLHNLILDGENNIPYNTGVSMSIDFAFEPVNDKYFISLPAASEIYIYQATFHPSVPEFSTLHIGSLAKGVCKFPAEPCFDFFDLYEPFYFDYQETPMTYEVTDNGDGTHQLIVTNIDGDQAIYNTFLLGNETPTVHSFKVVPNPTTDRLYIDSEFGVIEQLTVYDRTGRQVLKQTPEENAIDVSSLPQGLYFIEITIDAEKAIQKFIKN